MKIRAALLFISLSSVLLADGWEFDHVVKAIESHYGIRRTHVPLLGLASLFVKVGHPAGARDFKLAVFEDLKSSNGVRDEAALDRFMTDLSVGELHAVVRVHSRDGGESTYIFAGEAGRSARMLIATFERNEATVVEVKVDIETLLRTLDSPNHAGKTFRE